MSGEVCSNIRVSPADIENAKKITKKLLDIEPNSANKRKILEINHMLTIPKFFTSAFISLLALPYVQSAEYTPKEVHALVTQLKDSVMAKNILNHCVDISSAQADPDIFIDNPTFNIEYDIEPSGEVTMQRTFTKFYNKWNDEFSLYKKKVENFKDVSNSEDINIIMASLKNEKSPIDKYYGRSKNAKQVFTNSIRINLNENFNIHKLKSDKIYTTIITASSFDPSVFQPVKNTGHAMTLYIRVVDGTLKYGIVDIEKPALFGTFDIGFWNENDSFYLQFKDDIVINNDPFSYLLKWMYSPYNSINSIPKYFSKVYVNFDIDMLTHLPKKPLEQSFEAYSYHLGKVYKKIIDEIGDEYNKEYFLSSIGLNTKGIKAFEWLFDNDPITDTPPAEFVYYLNEFYQDNVLVVVEEKEGEEKVEEKEKEEEEEEEKKSNPDIHTVFGIEKLFEILIEFAKFIKNVWIINNFNKANNFYKDFINTEKQKIKSVKRRRWREKQKSIRNPKSVIFKEPDLSWFEKTRKNIFGYGGGYMKKYKTKKHKRKY
jgi:hypothetical protein